MTPISFKRHRFPPTIIQHAVWLYARFTLLDMASGLIQRAWLIPMSELGAVARVGAEKLSITPSAKEESRDRYTPYRCVDMAEVARRLAA